MYYTTIYVSQRCGPAASGPPNASHLRLGDCTPHTYILSPMETPIFTLMRAPIVFSLLNTIWTIMAMETSQHRVCLGTGNFPLKNNSVWKTYYKFPMRMIIFKPNSMGTSQTPED